MQRIPKQKGRLTTCYLSRQGSSLQRESENHHQPQALKFPIDLRRITGLMVPIPQQGVNLTSLKSRKRKKGVITNTRKIKIKARKKKRKEQDKS
jgi:hypothetical protein